MGRFTFGPLIHCFMKKLLQFFESIIKIGDSWQVNDIDNR